MKRSLELDTLSTDAGAPAVGVAKGPHHKVLTIQTNDSDELVPVTAAIPSPTTHIASKEPSEAAATFHTPTGMPCLYPPSCPSRPMLSPNARRLDVDQTPSQSPQSFTFSQQEVAAAMQSAMMSTQAGFAQRVHPAAAQQVVIQAQPTQAPPTQVAMASPSIHHHQQAPLPSPLPSPQAQPSPSLPPVPAAAVVVRQAMPPPSPQQQQAMQSSQPQMLPPVTSPKQSIPKLDTVAANTEHEQRHGVAKPPPEGGCPGGEFSPSGVEEPPVTPKTGRWTKREDELLREAVKEYGAKNWKRISDGAFHGLRTDVQCLHRWQKVLKPGLKKGQWTEEEDDIVRREVLKMGGPLNVKWSTVAESLPGRLGKQVRERWQNHLDPQLTKEPWDEEEDQLLISLQAVMGNRWSEIARAFHGRSENSVKNRWNSKQRKSLAAERKAKTGSELGVRVIDSENSDPGTTIKIDFRKALQAANRSSENLAAAEASRLIGCDDEVKSAGVALLTLSSKRKSAAVKSEE